IAGAGNDHRLGANEAPPAIISIFLGDMLTDIIEQVEKGSRKRTLKGGDLDLGARMLPHIPRHSGDRNRTSPFAFTGNKFEFRAVGSTAAVSWPNTVINAIVAESLSDIATQLEELVNRKTRPEKIESACERVLKGIIKEHKKVVFNGDNYSEDWQDEAAKRGLPNIKDSVDALPRLGTKKAKDVFKKFKILKPAEVDSRVTIFFEKLAHQLQIESEQMVLIGRQLILPAAYRQQTMFAEAVAAAEGAGVDTGPQRERLDAFVDLLGRFHVKLDELDTADNHADDDPKRHAKYLRDTIRPLMEDLRVLGDELETHVCADLWPLPSYRELLFLR
ncbi:MAG: glutamine synthetase type III, partial [Planctomycetota bacterium]